MCGSSLPILNASIATQTRLLVKPSDAEFASSEKYEGMSLVLKLPRLVYYTVSGLALAQLRLLGPEWRGGPPASRGLPTEAASTSAAAF